MAFPIDENGSLIITKKQQCFRCGEVTVRLVRNITTSGISQVYWRCPGCGYQPTKSINYIGHEVLKQYAIAVEKIPVNNDYSTRATCVVCGAQGAEVHHFAPRHLFGNDADKWPVANLCRACHKRWHDLVTPDMARVGRHGRDNQNRSIPVSTSAQAAPRRPDVA